MSKLFNSPITQETSPQASGMPLPTWRVKLSNGAVYGPIELGELPSDQHKEKPQLRIEQLQATVDESISRIKQLQSDIDSQQAQTLKLRNDTAALEKTYLVKLGDVQKNYEVAANMLEKAEAQVQALRNDQVRREKELVDRISSLSGQIQDSSGQIAEKNNVISRLEAELIKTRGDFEAGIRDLQDRLDRTTSDYDSTLNNLREKESSLSAAVRERELALQSAQALTERYEARVKEFDVQIGELAAQKQISERVISMENSVTEASNEAEQQKIRCQGLQEQLDQTDGEFKRREMLWVTEKAKLEQEPTALRQRLAESEQIAENIRIELHERELGHQAELKKSQDGIDEAMDKAHAADMECDKIRRDLDQLQFLFQERGGGNRRTPAIE